MEQLIAIVAGAVAVAVAPLVPAARPVAKGLVKGGLALGVAAAGAAAVAGKQFEQLRDSMAASRNPAPAPAEEPIAPGAEPDAAASMSPDLGAVPAAAVAGSPGAAATRQAIIAPGDDLTRISGIGPKAAALLASAGIASYAQLAAASEAELRAILLNAGPRFRLLDPSAWPAQASQLLSESVQ